MCIGRDRLLWGWDFGSDLLRLQHICSKHAQHLRFCYAFVDSAISIELLLCLYFLLSFLDSSSCVLLSLFSCNLLLYTLLLPPPSLIFYFVNSCLLFLSSLLRLLSYIILVSFISSHLSYPRNYLPLSTPFSPAHSALLFPSLPITQTHSSLNQPLTSQHLFQSSSLSPPHKHLQFTVISHPSSIFKAPTHHLSLPSLSPSHLSLPLPPLLPIPNTQQTPQKT